MSHALIVGSLLLASGMLIVAALVGFLGGFREVPLLAEDEVLARHVRREASS